MRACHLFHEFSFSGGLDAVAGRNKGRRLFAARAARTGRSLQEYVRSQLIELARRPDPEALLARIRERKEHASDNLPRERILSYREVDRR